MQPASLLTKILVSILIMFCLPPFVSAQGDGIDDEKAVKIFSMVLNGEAAARLHLVDLRRLATDTPYKPLAIVGISHQLLVWGWKESESKSIIKACANAAAGVGANDGQFTRITLSVGRLTDDEQSTYAAFSNLEDEGIPIWPLVSYLIGKSVEQSKSLSLEKRLKPRRMVDALVAGFNEKYAGAAEREAKRAKADKVTPPTVSQTSGDYQAEIVRTRLVPFTTAQGQLSQMLLIDWKNTGKQPIGQVKATMTFFDARGQQIDKVENYNIFVTYEPKKMIKPGNTYEEPNGNGFVVLIPDGSKAATAKAVLTKVSGVPLN